MQLATIITRTTGIAPAQPTIEHARTQLGLAQGAAGRAHDAPEQASYASLMQGARAASNAAAELLVATPRSQYQDLKGAAALAAAGAKLLGQAAYALDSEFSGPTIVATVKDLTNQAFNTFEDAFEIVDND